MDLAEVRELFTYNAWANRRVLAALHALPPEQYFRDLKSSHGGIHGTLCHIVWAEQLWLHRWLDKANPVVPQGKDLATLAAAEQRFRHAVDHSSYHRGQIVTLLRQLGVKPPSTGLIVFYREQATGRQISNF